MRHWLDAGKGVNRESFWFVIGLVVPSFLIAAAFFAAWLSSAEADRRLRDEEMACAQSLGPKPPGLAS
jgi:hypothetical protein